MQKKEKLNLGGKVPLHNAHVLLTSWTVPKLFSTSELKEDHKKTDANYIWCSPETDPPFILHP